MRFVWIWIAIGIILALCIAEWIREILTFKVTEYEITSPKFGGEISGKKIAFLTDLHNRTYGKNNEKLLEAIRESKPDLILVGGDMIVSSRRAIRRGDCERGLSFVEELAKICPVYCANGNHEQRVKTLTDYYGEYYSEYEERLKKAGIYILEDEKMAVLFGNSEASPVVSHGNADEQMKSSGNIDVYGLEIPLEKYGDHRVKELDQQRDDSDKGKLSSYEKECRRERSKSDKQSRKFQDNEIKEKLGDADKDKYNILLAHDPAHMERYLEWGADLVLCGHFHGGLVRIPGLGGMVTPQFRLFPKYSGEKTEVGDQTVVVSKGLGTHTFHIRFLNPAELVILSLVDKEGLTY